MRLLSRQERELVRLLRTDPVARNLAHRLAWLTLATLTSLVLVGAAIALVIGR